MGLKHSCNTNVAYYWGQNSFGGADSQMDLSNYTDDSHGDLFIISFVHVFFGKGGVPSMDIVHSCDDGTYFPGTDLLYCPQLGEDILASQERGKKVILSLGGAEGNYGFQNDTQAIQFADQIWNVFGNGLSSTRPFGGAVVDGFDLDIEQGSTKGYPAFVKRLRSHFSYDSSKDYIITAAPQCPLPDKYLTRALRHSYLDMIFIQYYNNGCGVTGWKDAGVVDPERFNFKEWDEYVRKYSKNSKIKLYLGIPGGRNAAKKGYANPFRVLRVASYLQRRFPRFGGIMVWDASEAWNNLQPDGRHFAEVIKEGLVRDGGCREADYDDRYFEFPVPPFPKPRRRQKPQPRIYDASGKDNGTEHDPIFEEEYELDIDDKYYHEDDDIPPEEEEEEYEDDGDLSDIEDDENFGGFDFYEIIDEEELAEHLKTEQEVKTKCSLPINTVTVVSTIIKKPTPTVRQASSTVHLIASTTTYFSNFTKSSISLSSNNLQPLPTPHHIPNATVTTQVAPANLASKSPIPPLLLYLACILLTLLS